MCIKINAVETLLPPEVIEQCKKNEKTLTAISCLVTNLIKEMIYHVQKRQPKELTPFAGDSLCQGRLILLPQLFEKVSEELVELERKIESIEKGLQELSSLEVSREALFLIDCRLLAVTRSTQSIAKNGIVYSKTEPGNLKKLSSKLMKTLGCRFSEQITQNACTRVSSETMLRLQACSRQMQVPELVQRMVQQVVVLKHEKYPPKTFGCQFFTMQLAFCHLLESQTPLAIKTIVPQREKSELIFFKAEKDDFVLQEEIPQTSYVAIFQAVVPSKANLIAKIKEIGFIELIMRYSAQEKPFHPKSTLEDVADREGRAVIEEYRKKAALSGCNQELMIIHHLYANTLQEEL